MNIELRKLIPLPVIEIPHKGSEVWEAKSLVFKKGEFISVVAGSGKGKTSLLSSIYGIRRDYRGSIIINHTDSREFKEKEWTQLRKTSLAYIFQGLELFRGLTALENILIKNRLTNYKTESEINEMAKDAGIYEFLNKKAGLLSFGQSQRVAILRALCQEMDFLLADEIFSHLDHQTGQSVFHLIQREIRKQNAGLIMTSLDKLEDIHFNRTLQL